MTPSIDPNPRAVAAMRAAIDRELYRLRGYTAPSRVLNSFTEAVVGAYFNTLAEERMNQRISPVTRALAKMQVGDEVIVRPGTAKKVVWSCMNTARGLMGNRRAVWNTVTLEGGALRVRRQEDGSRPERDPWRNRAAVLLAAIPVGETRLMPADLFKDIANALSVYRKQAARRLLGNPDAQWTGRTTTKGIRVKRTR